jgi:hypothetical protein
MKRKRAAAAATVAFAAAVPGTVLGVVPYRLAGGQRPAHLEAVQSQRRPLLGRPQG